jgi:photosystem II stability/assembly factor-like uncharacterized protein
MERKMQTLKISLLVFSISIIISAQEGWFWQNPLPQGHPLNATKFISGTTGWAVGDCGTIIHTTDGGVSWIQQSVITTENLNDIYFIDSNTGIIVGTHGLLLYSSDAGTTWDSRSLSNNNLYGICFNDSNNGLISGDQILLETNDGGLTWAVKWSTVSLLIDVAMIDLNTWITIGSNGMIYRTTNAGTNWNSVFYGDFYRSFSFSNPTNGVVVGISGKIRRTTNGGVDWNLQTSGTTNDLTDVLFIDELNGYAIGWNGTIIKTSDGGVNWSSQSSGTSFNLLGICMSDFNNGYIVGDLGKILRTTDSGTNWLQLSSGVVLAQGELRGISFYNNNTGLSVGVNFEVGGMLNGLIFKTTDGGTTWIQQLSEAKYFLDKVQFINQNKIIVVGSYEQSLGVLQGLILKTSNGGVAWLPQIISQVDIFTDLSFTDANNGTVVGANGAIWKTTNGGTTWNEQSSGTTYSLSGVSFIDTDNGMTVGESGIILRTTNGGDTWYQQNAGPFIEFYDVQMLTTDICYTVAMQGIYKTTDGGSTWQRISNHSANALNFVDVNHGTIVAGEGYPNIFRTTDGGISWSLQFSRTNYPLHDVNFLNLNEGWIVGKCGTILHTTNGGITFTENETNTSQPNKFLLSQNYPNPFNPRTSLQYAISSRQFVTLKVYDLLGREIATLVNEEKPAGEFEVEFDGANLPSGIYFYQLKAGEYSETRKMVLLK